MLHLTVKKQERISKKDQTLTYNQFKIIECICPEEIIISRLKNRKKGYSDADESIYKLIKAKYEPIEEKHITVDTSQSLRKIITEIKDKIKNES